MTSDGLGQVTFFSVLRFKPRASLMLGTLPLSYIPNPFSVTLRKKSIVAGQW